MHIAISITFGKWNDQFKSMRIQCAMHEFHRQHGCTVHTAQHIICILQSYLRPMCYENTFSASWWLALDNNLRYICVIISRNTHDMFPRFEEKNINWINIPHTFLDTTFKHGFECFGRVGCRCSYCYWLRQFAQRETTIEWYDKMEVINRII